jgi:hypothetical protein
MAVGDATFSGALLGGFYGAIVGAGLGLVVGANVDASLIEYCSE